MNPQSIAVARAAVAYIETHLEEKLDLSAVAAGVHYSKYHLHRTFAGAAGMTLHRYIQRRQLTEAARQLTGSSRPIGDIALSAGCESQQSFSGIFKAMYKKTPAEYRRAGRFYPLQLPLVLQSGVPPELREYAPAYAGPEDIPAWMDFAAQVADGLPGFEAETHLCRLQKDFPRRQSLLLRQTGTIIAALSFSRQTGDIHFLEVLPQYRSQGAEKALLADLLSSIPPDRDISITTFRAGDRADNGQRAAYQRLGFQEAELLTEFGYPTQRLVLPASSREAWYE